MTAIQFYPPVALASVVFSMWATVAYYFYKRDLSHGSESTLQILWMLTLPGSLLAFFYFYGLNAPLTSYFSLFMAALTGIGFGAMVFFFIRDIFIERGEPRRQRIVRFVYLAGFLGLLTMGFFISF